MAALLTTAAMAQHSEITERFNPEIYGVTSLAIAPDARAGAMGDMGVATDADANSQYWNCAKYPWNISRAGVSASYTPWLRKIVTGINLANLAGFYRIGDYSAISGSIRYFGMGEVSTTVGDYSFNPYEMAVDVAYSRMLSQPFSMGV
ncbi:MAG: PorV/PorQ family protein, partial [Bacteroidaceae bacterium]|nr:PorV/PorQ family protein [Bacteroidaceae bacterium]